MKGRTLYVIPYLMGPPGSPMSRVGVELTDSLYVVLNMRIIDPDGRRGAPNISATSRSSIAACIAFWM